MADTKKYQLNCLISPELNQKELEDFLKKIESLLLKTGEILKSEIAQKIKLKYPVRKKNEAFLVSFDFNGEAEKVENFKKEIEEEKNILRYLLIKNRERKEKIKDLKKELKKIKKENATKQEKVEFEKIEEKLKEMMGISPM
ncbi:30S ribosomal protein S6 [Patescibacteria group bacterium]|nr:30S ribosomal protein S6 [Patescibacteria group bacterium]